MKKILIIAGAIVFLIVGIAYLGLTLIGFEYNNKFAFAYFQGFFGGIGLMSAPPALNRLASWVDNKKERLWLNVVISAVLIALTVFGLAKIYPQLKGASQAAYLAFWIGFGIMTAFLVANKLVGWIDKALGEKGQEGAAA